MAGLMDSFNVKDHLKNFTNPFSKDAIKGHATAGWSTEMEAQKKKERKAQQRADSLAATNNAIIAGGGTVPQPIETLLSSSNNLGG